MPALDASSFWILNLPITPVCSTCGPPQNSREIISPVFSSKTRYIDTLSAYFSPNTPTAPSSRALAWDIISFFTVRSRAIQSLTNFSTNSISAAAVFVSCVKSNLVRSSVILLPFCRTFSPNTFRAPRSLSALRYAGALFCRNGTPSRL